MKKEYYKLINNNDISVLEINWNLWLIEFEQAFQEFKVLIKNWNQKIVFDLRNVEFINSRIAWWFFELQEILEGLWWNIVIVWMQEQIEDTLDLIWMFNYIKRAKTVEKWIQFLSRK